MSKPTLKNRKKLHVWIIAAIATPTIILVLFGLVAYQVPRYSYYFVKCGYRQPVKVINYASQTYEYVLLSSPSYRETTLFTSGFYCSEQEAISAGVRPYDS